MRRRARAAWGIFRAGAAQRLAYLGEEVVSSLYLVLILFIFRQLYAKVLPTEGALAGYDQARILWYLVVTEATLTSCPRLGHKIDDEVRSGQVSAFLCRPVSYVAYHRWCFLGEVAVAFPLRLLVGGAAAWWMVGPPPAGLELAWVLPPVAVGLALHFQVSITLGLSSFWMGDSTPLFWVYQKTLFLLGGLLVPLDFYPEAVLRVAEALPFHLVLHGPARLSLEPTMAAALALVLRQAAWLAVLLLLTTWLYRRALSKLTVQGG
jgi:ABC-2 type transport system permease protein